MNAPALEAIDLGCTLGHRRLFANLGFTLEAGRWLMLTGTNGAGKSTLLRILAGLIRPDSGEIRWQGHPRRAGDPHWNACLLYQGHATGWKEALSTQENLELQAWLDLADPRGLASAVESAIARVGLQRQRRLPFGRLSAGQRRRLGLARLALAPRPLWLLDEPTTALDTDGQALFAALLEEHLERGGCAVVATHLVVPTRAAPHPLRLGSEGATSSAGSAVLEPAA